MHHDKMQKWRGCGDVRSTHVLLMKPNHRQGLLSPNQVALEVAGVQVTKCHLLVKNMQCSMKKRSGAKELATMAVDSSGHLV